MIVAFKEVIDEQQMECQADSEVNTKPSLHATHHVHLPLPSSTQQQSGFHQHVGLQSLQHGDAHQSLQQDDVQHQAWYKVRVQPQQHATPVYQPPSSGCQQHASKAYQSLTCDRQQQIGQQPLYYRYAVQPLTPTTLVSRPPASYAAYISDAVQPEASPWLVSQPLTAHAVYSDAPQPPPGLVSRPPAAYAAYSDAVLRLPLGCFLPCLASSHCHLLVSLLASLVCNSVIRPSRGP